MTSSKDTAPREGGGASGVTETLFGGFAHKISFKDFCWDAAACEGKCALSVILRRARMGIEELGLFFTGLTLTRGFEENRSLKLFSSASVCDFISSEMCTVAVSNTKVLAAFNTGPKFCKCVTRSVIRYYFFIFAKRRQL